MENLMGPLRKLESLNIHCGVWTWLALYKTLIKKHTLKMCASIMVPFPKIFKKIQTSFCVVYFEKCSIISLKMRNLFYSVV